MAKIGRNESCPCGSGKKYKKCCLLQVEASRVEAMLRERQQTAAALLALHRSTDTPDLREHDGIGVDVRRLDELSNGVLDLIDEHRFDEALAVCEELLRDYPDVIDGLERSALVYEARGDHARAVDFYRQALAFTERPDQQEGFDEDVRVDFRDQIAKLEQRITAA